MEKLKNSCNRKKHFPSISKWGFSLVELMTVVVIVGILSAVGIPAYRQYTIQAKIADAYVMMDAVKKLELTYFGEHDRFFLGGANTFSGVMTDITSGKRVVLADNGFALQSLYFDDNGDLHSDEEVVNLHLPINPSILTCV